MVPSSMKVPKHRCLVCLIFARLDEKWILQQSSWPNMVWGSGGLASVLRKFSIALKDFKSLDSVIAICIGRLSGEVTLCAKKI